MLARFSADGTCQNTTGPMLLISIGPKIHKLNPRLLKRPELPFEPVIRKLNKVLKVDRLFRLVREHISDVDHFCYAVAIAGRLLGTRGTGRRRERRGDGRPAREQILRLRRAYPVGHALLPNQITWRKPAVRGHGPEFVR